MDREGQKRIVEALVLGAPEPVSAQKIAEIVPGLETDDARALVAELGREYEEQGRAFEIWEVAGGYQLRTRPEYASYLRLLHRERPLRLEHVSDGIYSVDGTPTDCVNIAITTVLRAKPDLVVSGINKGYNLGDDVTYSGTVAGALEGCLLGVPSIAVSLQRTQ